MGSKQSNFFQSDRPESGGADKDDQREKSGLLDRDKQAFAAEKAEEQRQKVKEPPAPDEQADGSESETIQDDG